MEWASGGPRTRAQQEPKKGRDRWQHKRPEGGRVEYLYIKLYTACAVVDELHHIVPRPGLLAGINLHSNTVLRRTDHARRLKEQMRNERREQLIAFSPLSSIKAEPCTQGAQASAQCASMQYQYHAQSWLLEFSPFGLRTLFHLTSPALPYCCRNDSSDGGTKVAVGKLLYGMSLIDDDGAM